MEEETDDSNDGFELKVITDQIRKTELKVLVN